MLVAYNPLLPPVRNLLAVLGVLWVAVLVIRGVGQFVSFLQAYVLSPVFGVGRADLTGYGSWAGECNLWTRVGVCLADHT